MLSFFIKLKKYQIALCRFFETFFVSISFHDSARKRLNKNLPTVPWTLKYFPYLYHVLVGSIYTYNDENKKSLFLTENTKKKLSLNKQNVIHIVILYYTSLTNPACPLG